MFTSYPPTAYNLLPTATMQWSDRGVFMVALITLDTLAALGVACAAAVSYASMVGLMGPFIGPSEKPPAR